MDFRDIKEFFLDAFKYVVFFGCILFIVVYCFSLQQVLGESMYPTFYDNDILILNKLKYRFSDIERGDVVALRFEDTNYLIKRVIGLPGETVEFKDNQLYINGVEVEEDYSDSRELGLVAEKDILGETSIRIFPFNRIKIFK